MLKVDDVLDILSIPLLGIIPESTDVARLHLGSPVTLADDRSAPAVAYFEAARRLQGESLPVMVPGEKRGFFGKIFGRKAAMNLFRLFSRSNSAPAARERLKVLLAHERATAGDSDLVSKLREEILQVISKHMQIDRDKVNVTMERGAKVSTLAVDVEIPVPRRQEGRPTQGLSKGDHRAPRTAARAARSGRCARGSQESRATAPGQRGGNAGCAGRPCSNGSIRGAQEMRTWRAEPQERQT